MDLRQFSGATGELVSIGGGEHAFVPAPLPDVLALDDSLWRLLMETGPLLGQIRGLTAAGVVGDPRMLIRPLQVRESLRSSSLEGTYVEADELLLYELDPEDPGSRTDPRNDRLEVLNLQRAMEAGEALVLDHGFGQWSIRSLHQMLLRGVRGEDKRPGEFRMAQVFIGADHRFVPPPPERLGELLDAFDVWVSATTSEIPALVRAGMAHYQVEAIHPFLDGNGRIGRLLLTLMIGAWTELGKPWVYLSPYCESHRDEYVDALYAVSARGDWARWLRFYLTAVRVQASDAVQRIELWIALWRRTQARIRERGLNTRTLGVVDRLMSGYAITVRGAEQVMGVSYNTARSDLTRMIELGLISEMDRRHPAAFWSSDIHRIINADAVVQLWDELEVARPS